MKKFNNFGIKESQLTSESSYLSRRKIIKTFGLTGLVLSNISLSQKLLASSSSAANPSLNQKFTINTLIHPLTSEKNATTYNNFYEFGSSKNIHKRAQKLQTSPWLITSSGEVTKKKEFDFRELIQKFSLEERYYRFRCVEAWAMAVPWTGFELKKLIDYLKPTSQAKYISFTTAQQPKNMPGLTQSWYPWPYLEALRIDEATNELAFIATGIYGKNLPKQNGAPLRLITPWKYGFKSIKSFNNIIFTKERPINFWQEVNPKEYGFFANVNPNVAHPRWSQSTERDLDTQNRRPTIIFNGYADYVDKLYANDNEQVFR